MVTDSPETDRPIHCRCMLDAPIFPGSSLPVLSCLVSVSETCVWSKSSDSLYCQRKFAIEEYVLARWEILRMDDQAIC